VGRICGITAYYGQKEISKVLLDCLNRLEYRGYDSAGLAFLADSKLEIIKETGTLDELNLDLETTERKTELGLGHTRWATHGDVSKENAHPHSSCNDRLAIAHNGILENWKELKEELDGHVFKSETDSEVAAHYIEEKVGEMDMEKAIQDFMKNAEGSYAIALLDPEDESLYVMKNGSPIVIGVRQGEVFVASDVYAFSPYTEKVLFLEDDQYASIQNGELRVKDLEGREVEKKFREVQWDQKTSDKEEFEHYMHKEIKEIPQALARLENSINTTQKERMCEFTEALGKHEKVIFTASGTSYHASLLGVYFLQKAGIEAQALIASEFKNYERVDDETLLIPVSQSGETKDVLEAMEYSKKRGAKIASITNVPHSTVERNSDINLRIKAGQELCVAATKTFTNQVYALTRIAEEVDALDFSRDLKETVSEIVQKNRQNVKELAEELKDEKDIYIIGKGETYPVAREIALKLKEIAYIHAEGMMAGELKHGTLALVEEGTPVISLIPEEGSEIVSNVKEAETRGAKTIKISPHYGDFHMPETENGDFSFHSTVIGFLLTYWIARKKGLPIDKPRNLAKSVTVQ